MAVVFKVVVVSDIVYQDRSRDISGKKAVEIIVGKGYKVYELDYIPNSFRDIAKKVMEVPDDVNVVVFLGGTGPSPRDITVDVIESMAWRKLPGFGETFRRISYEAEGIKAILSRAELYILSNGVIVVVLPGSPKAMEIGLNLLLGVIEHLIEEVKRFEGIHRPPTS
ncbi:MAG: molybdopterin-binding protein [Ignisphaera sp.]|uniref:MogA/MoaB family molybdenum cofactor biosynthesis protein n=1 Tax=Ignisphaera aggregans TaxID=334771 RepID=A0A7C4NSE2_9CREN